MKSYPVARTHTLVALAAVACVLWAATAAEARTALESICRVKGQEENTLRGLGFVIGLEGTGDDGTFLPTIRSLAMTMELLGEQLGQDGLAELKDTKNAALVMVTATVPGGGGRRGDKLDCMVSSIGKAKSLEGGQLFITPLVGPDKSNPTIYAFAEGSITLDSATLTRSGRVHGGCSLATDFRNVFTKDGKITLVLKKNYAGFRVAQEVATLVNDQLGFQITQGQGELAKGLDQVNIEVLIPPQYSEAPAEFVSQVLALPLNEPQTGARVVINERAGSIVITGDVEIGAAVVSHKNVVVETGTEVSIERFVPVDPSETNTPKLKSLVEALNKVNVQTEDIIEIIKRLDRSGILYGELIIE